MESQTAEYELQAAQVIGACNIFLFQCKVVVLHRWFVYLSTFHEMCACATSGHPRLLHSGRHLQEILFSK